MLPTTLHTAATTPLLPAALPRNAVAGGPGGVNSSPENRGAELREVFTQFVGETFYGQMIKAMRSTVGKPAYFHGGRGEEVFRSQLDQTMAQHMAAAGADKFSGPMFERQFPHLPRR